MSEQFQLLAGDEPPKRRVAKGFLGAYRAGRAAARKGQKPYPPYRARNDWRRVFRCYWREGFEDELAGQAERYEAQA